MTLGAGMSERKPEIGGYFQLEASVRQADGEAPHLGAHPVRLNSGRNCLRAVLANTATRRVHLPDYICGSVARAVRSCGVEPVFYAIDDQLRPRDGAQCDPDDIWLEVNYFGLMGTALAENSRHVNRFVADNCQAFFAPPPAGAVSIYSPRKFFGVPDGGYLVGGPPGNWPPDESGDRLSHLQLRADKGARAGYATFQAHEAAFADLPVRAMSTVTRDLLSGVDYPAAARRRRDNYRQLNAELGMENGLRMAVDHDGADVPLVYPFLANLPGLRADLARQGLFAASYWPDCLQRDECGPQARRLSRNLTALPIDQRYGPVEMKRVARAVQAHLAGRRPRLVVT